MPVYRAAWVLPIVSPPLANGWVQTERGRVVGCGTADTRPSGPAHDLGDVAVMPALVNAHTHLELSWLRDRIAPASNFVDWIEAMMRVRKTAADAADESAHLAAMATAAAEMRASGTGCVGDITNSLLGLDVLAAAGLSGVAFYELLGFNADAPALVGEARRRLEALPLPAGWRATLAPHAPYTVSPALFVAIREAVGGGVTSLHIAEGDDEVTFVATGGGRWRDILIGMRVWDEAWRAPGCSPVTYLDRLGFWRPGTMAVHAVQASAADLAILRERGVTLVTCPRSNVFVGAGEPPIQAFYESGAAVAVGTDSLTSVRDLNLFAELAELRRLAPAVPAARLLASATITGARALGCGDELGSIERGKRAALVAVAVPPGETDVEECLVRGIAPAQVGWIE
jgi:cytosine/adenosine deaminase-related metal-dependent hydrolase